MESYRTNLYNALLSNTSLNSVIDPWITTVAFSLREDMSFQTVEEIIKKSMVGSAPVLNKKDQVVGILTKANMVNNLFNKSSELNAKLATVLNAMHNGVVAFDDQGCISLTNKSAEKMLGLSPGKSLGLRWDESKSPGLRPTIHRYLNRERLKQALSIFTAASSPSLILCQ